MCSVRALLLTMTTLSRAWSCVLDVCTSSDSDSAIASDSAFNNGFMNETYTQQNTQQQPENHTYNTINTFICSAHCGNTGTSAHA